jgi:WD40 repeat protein
VNTIVTFNNIVASGDDEGTIKIWDVRKKQAVHELKEHEDYISSMTFGDHNRRLLATGGDGYLSVWNFRKGKLEAMSDNQEEELLSLALVKDERKLVVGTQEGVLSVWDWGDWGDLKDRVVGHPRSIDCIEPIDQDTVLTGSSDGFVRVVSIFPNLLVGALGFHTDAVGCIKFSYQRQYATSAAGNIVRFWSTDGFFDADEPEDEQPAPQANEAEKPIDKPAEKPAQKAEKASGKAAGKAGGRANVKTDAVTETVEKKRKGKGIQATRETKVVKKLKSQKASFYAGLQ